MVEDKIINKVEEKRDEVVELLRALIQIPSVTGEEGKAQEFVTKNTEK